MCTSAPAYQKQVCVHQNLIEMGRGRVNPSSTHIFFLIKEGLDFTLKFNYLVMGMPIEDSKTEIHDVGHGEDSVSVQRKVEVKELGLGVDAILVYKPRVYILDALENKDWFKGIVLSATFFEHFGLERLKEHFKGKISPKRLEDLNLASIITLLFGCNIIDESTYTRMIEVKNKRNDLVHQPWENVVLSDKDGKTILKKALQCLKALGV